MPQQYQSTHTGAQIDSAVDTALTVIPGQSDDYPATSLNKLTPVSQVNAILVAAIDEAIAASY